MRYKLFEITAPRDDRGNIQALNLYPIRQICENYEDAMKLARELVCDYVGDVESVDELYEPYYTESCEPNEDNVDKDVESVFLCEYITDEIAISIYGNVL
jgi:hypothetical protein